MRPEDDIAAEPPALSIYIVGLLLATAVGAAGALLLLPQWLPGLSGSLLGTDAKAYWYLARSSAFAAYGLLWLAMIFGLLITNKLTKRWPNAPTAFDLHQHTSLLGLGFAVFHAAILLGDRYIGFSLLDLFVPFASSYRPLWVGLGQLALYLLALVAGSFYLKRWLGRWAWRLIHFLSFALFLGALAHGIGSGTDSASLAVQAFYWLTGGSVLLLTVARVLGALLPPARSRSRGVPGV